MSLNNIFQKLYKCMWKKGLWPLWPLVTTAPNHISKFSIGPNWGLLCSCRSPRCFLGGWGQVQKHFLDLLILTIIFGFGSRVIYFSFWLGPFGGISCLFLGPSRLVGFKWAPLEALFDLFGPFMAFFRSFSANIWVQSDWKHFWT